MAGTGIESAGRVAADEVDAGEVARRIRLATLDDVATEIGRVYRDMRARRIDTQTGTRLVYVLGVLAKVKEVSIERRLEALEQALGRERLGA